MIEDLTEVDVPAALAIDLVSFPPSQIGSEVAREKALREELARAWAHLRVAKVDGAVVGYCLFWHVVDEIHLLNIAVAPAARRRGIGRALLVDLLAYARSHAITKVILEARAGNTPALALYEAHGFERTRTRKGYYDDGEDGVEMLLEFG